MINESVKENNEGLCTWKKDYNDLKKAGEPTFDELRAKLVSLTCSFCSGYNRVCAYYDGKVENEKSSHNLNG